MSIRLPDAATLPAALQMSAAAVREALGVSKAVIHLWRRDHGFPRHLRRGWHAPVATDELEAWLTARNVAVTRLPPGPPAPPPMPMPSDFQPHEAVT